MMKVPRSICFVVALLCIFLIESGVNAESLSSTAPAAGFTPTPKPLVWGFTRDLTLGISGSDVSALQQFLIAGGFLKTSTPTDYFGALTKSALSAWQASAGISPPTGFFGPISREKIKAGAKLTSPGAIPAPTTSGTTTAATDAKKTSSVLPAGKPARFKIPKLNVDAGFQYTGLKPDGTMEIPDNIVDVGWFTGSVLPGEKGVSIITGHVAQIRKGVLTKPGVFNNLNELRPGDKLSVLNGKGESITFTVRESRSYDPTADATDVFTSTDSGAHLNIITCEGAWNPSKLSYSQRLVVFTDLAK